MRKWWVCLVLVAACGNNDTSMNPVTGGGDAGPTVDSSRPPDGQAGDSGGVVGDAGTLPINGRVCLANDPRALVTAVSPSACASSGAGGFRVELDGNTAFTNADGTFTISGVAQSGLMSGIWKVSGSNIVTSYMEVGDSQIPAITTATYSAMRTANNIATGYGECAVMAILIHDGAGAPGYTVTTSPAGDYLGFYDGTSQTVWTRTATGTFGAAWLPNIDAGNQTVSVKVFSGMANPATVSARIFDQSITFVPIVL